MSGIFGFVTKYRNAAKECLHALDVWNRCYGEDDSDMKIEGNLGVGCHLEHLSEDILCPAPILDSENKIAVIDAVLYNRSEILSLLKMKKTTTISDEELILALIKQKGYAALAQVNGDFAGAVYDKLERTWTLFRDHMGIRPLYYYKDKSIFAFSTDLRGLAALPNADLSINEEKLYLRMSGHNDLTLCETEFANIRCTHPASWNIVTEMDNGYELKKTVYWKLGQKKIRLKSDEAYQAELRRLITDAVKVRMDAVTGIVGGELSGGLDSSVIAILMNHLGRKGKFYSWSFTTEELPLQEGLDERKIIQDICEQENITCEYSRKGDPFKMDPVFQKIDPPYLNTRFISEGAAYLKKQGVKAVFTGHGGDEGVSHRSNLFEIWYHHEYKDFITIMYQSTKGQRLRVLRTLKRMYHQIFVVHPYFKKPFNRQYIKTSQFLNKEFVERMKKKANHQPLYFAYSPIEYIMQGGTRVRLDNIAVQGAENGVRYMVPFLDYRVIDFAVSIPRNQYNNGKMNRYIYRKAFDDIIPQSLREMNYKDAPSQRDYYPDFDFEDYLALIKTQLLQHLDEKYWESFLNMEEIKNIKLPEDYTWDDCTRMSAILNALVICGAIQNVKDKARKWSEEHE